MTLGVSLSCFGFSLKTTSLNHLCLPLQTFMLLFYFILFYFILFYVILFYVILFYFILSLFIYFERERERESELGRGREGERESQADSTLPTQNPTWGLNSQLWNHDLSQNPESDAYLTEPPRCPYITNF